MANPLLAALADRYPQGSFYGPILLTQEQRTEACSAVDAHCDKLGHELFTKIIARAEQVGGEYLAALNTWLVQGSTLQLRDELCAPFGGQVGWKEKLDHFNAFADIDTAGLKARDPNYG